MDTPPKLFRSVNIILLPKLEGAGFSSRNRIPGDLKFLTCLIEVGDINSHMYDAVSLFSSV